MASCQPSPWVSGCPPGWEPQQPGIRLPVHQPWSRLHRESSTPSAQSSQTLWLVPPHQASSPSSEATLLSSASGPIIPGVQGHDRTESPDSDTGLAPVQSPSRHALAVCPRSADLYACLPPLEHVLPTPNLPGPQLPHGHRQGDGARLSGPMRLLCTRDVPPAEVRGTCPVPPPQKSQPGTGDSAGADPP